MHGARGCVTDMTVLYECICSDHLLLSSIDFSVVPAYGTGGTLTSESKRVIQWDNLRPCGINHYRDYTDLERSKIAVPQGIKCNYPNCHTTKYARVRFLRSGKIQIEFLRIFR